MKRLIRFACGLFFLSILWFPAQVSAQGPKTHCVGKLAPISKVFDETVIVLRSKTSIPIRLPTCVWGVDPDDQLYAIVISADESRYEVVLGATPNCKGQHACSYGTIIGTALPLDQNRVYDVTRRPRALVKLRHELTGYFYASVCGAYCSDSFITWTEGTHHYIIGLKAEEKANLLASVNSAIEASAGQSK